MEYFHHVLGDQELSVRMKIKRLKEDSELVELKNRFLDCELPFSERSDQEELRAALKHPFLTPTGQAIAYNRTAQRTLPPAVEWQ